MIIAFRFAAMLLLVLRMRVSLSETDVCFFLLFFSIDRSSATFSPTRLRAFQQTAEVNDSVGNQSPIYVKYNQLPNLAFFAPERVDANECIVREATAHTAARGACRPQSVPSCSQVLRGLANRRRL
jgi:hypothetical protein